MGWGNCGTDSNGRPIGYVFEAVCDHEGCESEIHRGLSYACGDMHGDDVCWCEKYFCGEHQTPVEEADGHCFSVCDSCLSCLVLDDDMIIVDEEEP